MRVIMRSGGGSGQASFPFDARTQPVVHGRECGACRGVHHDRGPRDRDRMAAPVACSQGYAAKELRSLGDTRDAVPSSWRRAWHQRLYSLSRRSTTRRRDRCAFGPWKQFIFATVGLGVRDSHLQTIVAGGEKMTSDSSSIGRSGAVSGPKQLLSVTITLSQCEQSC